MRHFMQMVVVSVALLGVAVYAAVAADAPATTGPAAAGVIRIKAGADKPFTDKAGNVWQADTGFDGGDTIARPDLTITGTDQPGLFLSEHYNMTAFSQTVPNGKYTVKLYFAETYEEVTAAGQRVFDFNVEGQDVKKFDPFKEAGGVNKAVVKSFDVEVTDGKVDIKFTAGEQAPNINAIEIIPKA